jgi:hypothetical protein
MKSAITHAKIGRSMKNWAMAGQRGVDAAAEQRRRRSRRCSRRGLPRHRLHRRGAAQLLEAVDHHHLAGLDAVEDDPVAALRGADLHRPRRDLALAVDHHDAVAGRAALHRLLRHDDAGRRLRLLETNPDVHPRQQEALRVRHLGAQRDLARGRIDAQVGEEKLARLRIDAAVLEDDADAGRFGAAGRLEPAALDGTAQVEQLGRRLREVDVHRVDLLDQRQRRRLALADERAFGDERAADPARDRRRHRRIAEADLGALQVRPGRRDIGLGGLLRGDGVDVVLLADRVGFDERLVALGLRRRLRQVGLGARDLRLDRGDLALQRRRVDLEQQLAGLDVAAFDEDALEQDARNARAHLGDARRLEAAGQFGDEADGLRLHRHHADFGRRRPAARAGTLAARCRGRVVRLRAAGRDERGDGDDEQRRAPQGRIEVIGSFAAKAAENSRAVRIGATRLAGRQRGGSAAPQSWQKRAVGVWLPDPQSLQTRSRPGALRRSEAR